MENIKFRKANLLEAQEIWEILQAAIERRRQDGSTQWQNGYPNLQIVEEDIAKNKAFVLSLEKKIIAYCAISKSDEPNYEVIEGKWLHDGDYLVIHRMAIAENFLKKGLGKKLIIETENLAKQNAIKSIRIDTIFDNLGMLNILEKLNYQYCGIIYANGAERKAFEKIII